MSANASYAEIYSQVTQAHDLSRVLFSSLIDFGVVAEVVLKLRYKTLGKDTYPRNLVH